MSKFTNTISISWQLLKRSCSFLSKNKDLIWLPIIGLISQMLFLAITVFGLFETILHLLLDQKNHTGFMGGPALNLMAHSPYLVIALGMLLFMAIILTSSFITMYLNTTMFSCIAYRLINKPYSLMSGFRFANQRIKRIFQWSLVASLVGWILHQIKRIRFIGPIIASVLGITWSLATFFALPVMVFQDKGPIEAIKYTKSKLSSTWARIISVNMIFSLAIIAIVLVFVGAKYLLLKGIVPPTEAVNFANKYLSPIIHGYLYLASYHPHVLLAIITTAISLALLLIMICSTLQNVVRISMFLNVFSGRSNDFIDKQLLAKAVIKKPS